MLSLVDPTVFRGIERLVMALNVPLLMYVGYRLFLKGYVETMEIDGKAKGVAIKAAGIAPGVCCFALATLLGVYIMGSKLVIDPAIDGKHTAPSPSGARPSPRRISWLDGGLDTEGVELSTQFKRVFVEAALVLMSESQKCQETMGRKLKLALTLDEWTHIEALEAKARGGDEAAAQRLRVLRTQYLRDDKR